MLYKLGNEKTATFVTVFSINSLADLVALAVDGHATNLDLDAVRTLLQREGVAASGIGGGHKVADLHAIAVDDDALASSERPVCGHSLTRQVQAGKGPISAADLEPNAA